MRETVLMQADERYEPPEQPVLNLAVIGERTYLSVVTYEQDATTTTMTKVAEVCVSTDQLLLALHASVHSDARRPITKPSPTAARGPERLAEGDDSADASS